MSDFGPGNDLRSTQFAPQASDRLQATGGTVDAARDAYSNAKLGTYADLGGLDTSAAKTAYGQAASGLAGANAPTYKEVGGGTYARGKDTQGATDILSKELANLSTAPDRQQMALDTLKLAEEQGQPAYDQRMREVGRNAAKFGRIGAGMTTNELTSIEQVRSRDLDQLRRGTALEAAGQTMADRLSKTGMAGSVAGQLSGRDIDETGVNQGLRGELRTEAARKTGLEGEAAQLALQKAGQQQSLGTSQLGLAEAGRQALTNERGFAANTDQARAALAGSQLQDLAGLETNQFNKEAAQRGELRGERDHQTEAANKALEDSIRQRQLQEDLTQGAYGRDMGRAQLGLQGANIAQGNADQSQTGVNEFLQQLAMEEALRKRTGG
jgi:hypothetical protein